MTMHNYSSFVYGTIHVIFGQSGWKNPIFFKYDPKTTQGLNQSIESVLTGSSSRQSDTNTNQTDRKAPNGGTGSWSKTKTTKQEVLEPQGRDPESNAVTNLTFL